MKVVVCLRTNHVQRWLPKDQSNHRASVIGRRAPAAVHKRHADRSRFQFWSCNTFVHTYSSLEMNTPQATFTSSGATDGFLVYYQELLEVGKYIDLEIDVSCCAYK